MRTRRPRIFSSTQNTKKRTFEVVLPSSIDEIIENRSNNKNESSESNETTLSYIGVDNIDKETLKAIVFILKVINQFQMNSKETNELQVENFLCKRVNSLLYDSCLLPEITDYFIYNDKIKGKTGSLIFYSSDFEYTIKIIRNSELECALKHIDAFSKHYSTNKNTFVCKIVSIYSTSRFNFILMKNIFKNVPGQVFDLKSYNLNRKSSSVGIEDDWRGRKLLVGDKKEVMDILRADVEFLKSLNLMDYSLVVGVDFNIGNDFKLYNGNGVLVKKIELEKENKSLNIGIVDVLTMYNFSKKFERFLQIFCCIGSGSSKHPEKYGKDFLDFVENECFEENIK